MYAQHILDAIAQAELAGEHSYNVWARENETGGTMFSFDNASDALKAIAGAIGYDNVDQITAVPILSRYAPTRYIYSR